MWNTALKYNPLVQYKEQPKVSKESFMNFLKACAEDEATMQKYTPLALNELLLHARSAGYDFTVEDMSGVIGPMEVNMIMEKMGEEINAFSSLWPKMWGKPRLVYVVDELYKAFSEDELKKIID